jgi:N-methylhydantoinase A/oxoprolinase/acetone carboxylase beta subunit
MASHTAILIGIDTGGTYTDAVALDRDRHTVIATAKALTTKGDLSVGISEALTAVLNKLSPVHSVSDIGMLSLSTTLATNAVVEGHGNSVALFLIGFDDAMAERTGLRKSFPELPIIRFAGGHDHNGHEVQPLDIDAIERAADALKSKVSAFAIASSFAVRNPRHELRARDIVSSISGMPVTMSRELTSSLDAPRRAMTAVLNARLVSRISMLVASVRRSMQQLGIEAPLMVVRGDGSLADATQVALRPIETVLSGPAASMIGAKWLCERLDFIMSDIGGTTTDVGIMSGGSPKVAEQGAEVGGWRTMVQAIDVRTIGLGGDSLVQVGLDRRLTIGPRRAVPVSLLGHHFPEVLSMLEADLSDTDFSSLHGRFALLPFAQDQRAETAGVSERERALLATVGQRPIPLRRIAASSSALRSLETLARRGLVQLSGFTPSDAAHVLGLQANWSRRAAELAAAAAVRLRDMRAATDEDVNDFCQSVWSETVALSARAIIETASGQPLAGNMLAQAACDGTGQVGLARVTIGPTVPIVAVGGPARVFYEEVGRRLASDVVFVKNFDVANAIGAAAGLVGLRTSVSVEGDGSGLFRIFSAEGVQETTSGVQALQIAEELARRLAAAELRQRGARQAEVKIRFNKSYLPEAQGEDGLLKAEVIAEASGEAGLL